MVFLFVFQKKINNFEVDYNSLEKRHNDLNGEHERLREHVRKVEQLNDDLERTNRVVSATVSDLEAMLTEAYEKNQLLESEVEDKESLTEKHQRVLDELRGLYSYPFRLDLEKNVSKLSFNINFFQI